MSVYDDMQKRRDALKAELDALLGAASTESRELTATEDTKVDELFASIKRADERLKELRDAQVREDAANETRRLVGVSDPAQPKADTAEVRTAGGAKVSDPEVYAKGNVQRSYFRDLGRAQVFGDRDAADRLARHARAMADKPETRALGNTNTTGGSGGLVLLAAV